MGILKEVAVSDLQWKFTETDVWEISFHLEKIYYNITII